MVLIFNDGAPDTVKDRQPNTLDYFDVYMSETCWFCIVCVIGKHPLAHIGAKGCKCREKVRLMSVSLPTPN